MQTSLSTADQAFRDEVRAFVDAHWRPPDGFDGRRAEGFAPHERAWTQALVARGWSVPGWPVEHGGAGWPARWLYLWRRELAQAGAPGLDECGMEWAGPALWSWGDAAQQARFLAAIREGRERWCLGLVEPEAGSDHGATRTHAVGAADAYVVDGAKAWVAGAERARWMLALARTGGADCEPEAALSLLVIDLEAPGLAIRPVRMLGDQPGMATVACAGVRVPLTQRVGAEGAGLAMVRALEQRADGLFEPAAGLSALARKLAAAAAELPGDEGPLSEDPAFARKLAELGVDLAGLEALEQRHVWQHFGSGSDLPIAMEGRSDLPIAIGRSLPHQVAIGRSLLRLRHARVAERIGELFVEAFGYYSLPYPDPLAIDNEGPIGHHYALAALKGMFAGRTPPADGDPGTGLRDRIANQLFGY